MIYFALVLLTIIGILIWEALYLKGQAASFRQALDERIETEKLQQKHIAFLENEMKNYDEKIKSYEKQLKDMDFNQPWIIPGSPK